MGNKIIFLIALITIVTFGLYRIDKIVLAETSGSSPDSVVTSTIKTIYDTIVSFGQGSDSAGGWGDFGAYWNRIRSAVVDFSKQSLATKDDYLGTYKDDDSSWTEVTGSPFTGYGALGLYSGKVKKDERTGLWWSDGSLVAMSNVFTLTADGTRPTGGNAITFCDALNTANYGGKTSWYLPTQKELMQAYIDGIYSQDAAFGDGNPALYGAFWSSSQSSAGSNSAWFVDLDDGGVTTYTAKSSLIYYAVRCVCRD